ncbi:MAG: DUF4876 domain-containing protein [Rikenellaceae bacterium]|nr:DUF4876 domain-containing protein [Rikenellaceae bacterium]
MKRLLYIVLLPLALAFACSDTDSGNPYEGRLHTLAVNTVYPEGFEEFRREGVTVRIEDIDRGNTYTAVTDGAGRAEFSVTNGIYRVLLSDRFDEHIFNGTADRVKLVDDDTEITLSLLYSKTGTVIIKEVYCGGCTRAPLEGTYQSDKYIILHNNNSRTEYLDGICLGSLDPYNSQATNVWVTQDAATGESIYPEFAPIAQCIWQFPGDGTTFPLEPGEDAVVVICGAIDHTIQYEQSVNLNREGYFVCYNNVYFPNTVYHPAPGDRISADRYLEVVIKTGQANAYTLSIYSPAVVIFRAEETSMLDFVQGEDNVVQKPGSSSDRVVAIPYDWIMDGVEVFYGGSSNNQKRLSPSVDAGYVTQSEIYTARTLHRYVDEELTAERGYEVLTDTNNSSNDFYERERQSLHD